MTDRQKAQDLRAQGKTLAEIAVALGRNPKHTGSISRMLKDAAPFTHSGEVATTAAVTEVPADSCICEIPFTGMDPKCWSCADADRTPPPAPQPAVFSVDDQGAAHVTTDAERCGRCNAGTYLSHDGSRYCPKCDGHPAPKGM